MSVHLSKLATTGMTETCFMKPQLEIISDYRLEICESIGSIAFRLRKSWTLCAHGHAVKLRLQMSIARDKKEETKRKKNYRCQFGQDNFETFCFSFLVIQMKHMHLNAFNFSLILLKKVVELLYCKSKSVWVFIDVLQRKHY